MPDNFHLHAIEYTYKGETWVMEIPAESPQDALERVSFAAQFGVYLGEVKARLPLSAGWLAKLACWIQNFADRRR